MFRHFSFQNQQSALPLVYDLQYTILTTETQNLTVRDTYRTNRRAEMASSVLKFVIE